jgi:hypothetical protein
MRSHDHLVQTFGSLSPYQSAPDFWTATPASSQKLLDGLKHADIHTIGTSVSGRPILAISYGKFEPLACVTTNNLHSALASKVVPPDVTDIFPTAFYGTQRRQNPSLILQGGIHAGELTGTVASLNLCHILETGRDLRGKPWPDIQTLAQNTRITVIPWLNIDGVHRWPFLHTHDAPPDLVSMASMGILKDGTPLRYPQMKTMDPISPDTVQLMGSYFNDNGVNLQYDCFAVQRQPETTAWMSCYSKEKPDAVLVWHCNNGSLFGPPEYYLPTGHQHTISRLSGAVLARLRSDNLPYNRMSWADIPGMGKPFFEQSTAIYHTCGATPLMCELPIGMKPFSFTLDTMLDVGLTCIQETLRFGHDEGFRPYEYWSKVKAARTAKQ